MKKPAHRCGRGRRYRWKKALLEVRLDLLDEVGFWLRADQFVDNLAALDEQDGGDAGDAVVYGQLRIMVDIDLPDVDSAVVFLRQFFDDGSDRAAGTAPFRPKIND